MVFGDDGRYRVQHKQHSVVSISLTSDDIDGSEASDAGVSQLSESLFKFITPAVLLAIDPLRQCSQPTTTLIIMGRETRVQNCVEWIFGLKKRCLRSALLCVNEFQNHICSRLAKSFP
ncbi:hypothetical protein QYM36_015687 [Artemia franciscana]|uniref:Uncharacterized protein n=1 Tax=Artemia franciscana TaxID=6661 RepID=A0AA88HLV0_ARTSF|nr:hypothetical protein QYM36_015687 [Artemia franciscana]